jgi:hypothetical protein
MGDDSSDDGTGVHGRTTISGNESIFRLNRLSKQNMLSLSYPPTGRCSKWSFLMLHSNGKEETVNRALNGSTYPG